MKENEEKKSQKTNKKKEKELRRGIKKDLYSSSLIYYRSREPQNKNVFIMLTKKYKNTKIPVHALHHDFINFFTNFSQH